MKNKPFVFTLLSITFLFGACFSNMKIKVDIDKNKLASNVVVKFVDKDITLKQDDVFYLSQVGLESNKIKLNHGSLKITEINYILKAFKNNNYVNYDITIKSPNYAKPYHGKIAFFNTSKNKEMDAVARYREITIDNTYFTSATRGRVAIMYEYSSTNLGLMNQNVKLPTWIIVMSDEPF
jgi:hypothetical protein